MIDAWRLTRVALGEESADLALSGGRVVVELAIPLFGTMSDRPWIDTARGLTALDGELKAGGCRGGNPPLTLLTVSFTTIPALRFTAEGYRLVREDAKVGLY